MIWTVVYAVGLLALFVRFASPDAPPEPPPEPELDEPLRLVTLHHLLFYVLLLATPIEALALGGAAEGRALGATLFGLGVIGYRTAGAALGSALSPFIAPRPGGTLVTTGLYRFLRHPMYVSQASIAVGAPLTLGSRHVIWLAVPAVCVLVLRAVLEDHALARTFPEFPRYAARTKRLVPFVF